MTLNSRSPQHGTHNAPRTSLSFSLSLFHSFRHSMCVSRVCYITTICINYSHLAKYSRLTINDVREPRGRIQISYSIIYIIGLLSRVRESPFVNLAGKKSGIQKKIGCKTYVVIQAREYDISKGLILWWQRTIVEAKRYTREIRRLDEREEKKCKL